MIDEKKLIDELNGWSILDKEMNELVLLCIDTFKRMINEQPKVGEWIPVEERLPENCSSVLCYSILNGVEQGCYNPSTDTWIMFRWGELTGKVTYWQPLPEKPKGETE